jgi:hypothetical protein
MRIAAILALALAASGCVTSSATYGAVRKELATECVENCEALGMHLSAVVIISNSAGCVCEPTAPGGEPPRAGAAAAAGGAAIAAARASEQQQQSRQTGSIPSVPSIPSIR